MNTNREGLINSIGSNIDVNGQRGTTGLKLKTVLTDIVDSTYTKDEVDERSVSAEEITWSALKAKRDASQLVKGRFYRIIDYVTKVHSDTGEEQSAEHQFDVIVVADDVNVLNENARVGLHSGDTYFADNKLNAWEIKYCLDNDNTRFLWADITNGKGVIYFMRDEFGNECPYDFKNVQFKRYYLVSTKSQTSDLEGQYLGYIGQMRDVDIDDPSDFIWCYTFSMIDGAYNGEYEEFVYDYSQVYDASLNNFEGFDVDGGGYAHPLYLTEKNRLSTARCAISVDEEFGSHTDNTILMLNNIVFLQKVNWFNDLSVKEYNGISANSFGLQNYNISFAENCPSNKFGYFIHDCVFGNNCYSNTFGNECESNTFGNECKYNTFGNYCGANTFGNSCGANTFGNSCDYNTFSNECKYNTFGNECNSNTFGNDCRYNTFGNYCRSNTFGNECKYNTFGNNCRSNTFGNECNSNTFGNNCEYNTFGNGAGNNALTKDNYRYIKLEDGVQFCDITTALQGGANVQNYLVKSSVKGVSNSRKTINAERGLNYDTTCAINSEGDLETYCEADIFII